MKERVTGGSPHGICFCSDTSTAARAACECFELIIFYASFVGRPSLKPINQELARTAWTNNRQPKSIFNGHSSWHFHDDEEHRRRFYSFRLIFWWEKIKKKFIAQVSSRALSNLGDLSPNISEQGEQSSRSLRGASSPGRVNINPQRQINANLCKFQEFSFISRGWNY